MENRERPYYSIENVASDRLLEAYAVSRIYQLEAQVEKQKNDIIQLKKGLDNHQKLIEMLQPHIELSLAGDTRRITLRQTIWFYRTYDKDVYNALVSQFGLYKEDYACRLQEYKNEILNGTQTDLTDEEREEVKADYERR